MYKAMMIGMIFMFAVGVAVIARAEQSDNPGKAAFLSNKCNMCHSVQSEKIEKASGGYQTSNEKNVPPDLSGIGKKQNADWFTKYLKHQEAINGMKHAKAWRGTDEELQTLTKWLENLK